MSMNMTPNMMPEDGELRAGSEEYFQGKVQDVPEPPPSPQEEVSLPPPQDLGEGG